VNIERTKRVLFLLAAVLTGVCVSVAGVIGFVGLVVPHVLRIFIGPDHRLLLPASFLTGAAFLSLCDKLSDILLESAPLPVGVITGIIGGTVFIIALRKRQVTL
jgi:iron complex transport system permease protein